MDYEVGLKLMTEAERAYDHQDIGRAAYLCNEVLARIPNYAPALLLRALCVEEPELAIADASQVILHDARNAEALTLRAYAFEELNDYKSALSDWEAAIAAGKDYPDCHTGRGRSLWALWRMAEALAAFRKALELEPEYYEANWLMASLLYQEGCFELALRYTHPEYYAEDEAIEFLALHANCLARLRRFEESRKAFLRFLDFYPDELTPDDWLTLAEVELRLGLVEDAHRSLKRSAELKGVAGWHATLGEAQIAGGAKQDGIASLNQALHCAVPETQSYDRDYEYNLACVHALRARVEEQYTLSAFDAAAERLKAATLLAVACKESPVLLRFAQSEPDFDPLWSIPELQRHANLAP